MATPGYICHANTLADRILRGDLAAGSRLWPVREYAYQHGIAASTAARVYAELVRRGLVSGEVGRGSYVRGPAAPVALSEPSIQWPIDLEFNAAPAEADEIERLSAILARVMTHEPVRSINGASSAFGSPTARQAVADHLAYGGWHPVPGSILFAGGGRQAIAGAIAALSAPGEPVAMEALTYPMTKAIAAQLGRPAVPIALKPGGVDAQAIETVWRAHGARVVYLQPTLHNPLGITLDIAQRQAIADCLETHDLYLIEDSVYAFLDDEAPAPIASLAPDRVIHIDSLSKRGFSGMPLGLVSVLNGELRDRLANVLRTGSWLAPAALVAMAGELAKDDLLREMEQRRRQDAAARHALIAEYFDSEHVKTNPRAYHAWLTLPRPWRADAFRAEAIRMGVAVTAASNFAVQSHYAPNAVRLALSKPPLTQLNDALQRLARLIRSGDEMTLGTE